MDAKEFGSIYINILCPNLIVNSLQKTRRDKFVRKLPTMKS